MIHPYLVSVAVLAASAATHAQPPGGQPQGLRSLVATPPVSTQPAAPRQLSAQELADLRKMLTQNSKHAGKGS